MASLGLEPTPRYLEQVRLGEDLGFDCFFHNDAKWRREVYVRLGAAAATTSRIGLGTSVTDPYTRHPAVTAQATATIADLAPGRLTVILGSGSHFDTLPGYSSRKPIAALRETTQLMRQMWTGEPVRLDGEIVKVRDAVLEFVPQPAPEIWIASRGERILALAGEIGDGVLIGSFATPPGIGYAMQNIAKGLKRAGRDRSDINVASWLYVSLLDHEDDAVPDSIRVGISHAFWSSRAVLTRMADNLAVDITGEFRRFTRDAPHEWWPEIMKELRRLIPRGLMDSLAVIGTPAQVVAKLRALEAAGVDHAVIWPFPKDGQSVEEFMRRVAETVLPEVRSTSPERENA